MKTQNQIAKQLGISYSAWLNKKNGFRSINLDNAEKLAKIFGRNPIWWMKATPEQVQEATKKAVNNGS